MGDAQPLPKPDTVVRSLLAPSPPPASRRPAGHLQNGKARAKSGDGQKKLDNLTSEDEDDNDEDAQLDGNAPRHKVRLFDRTASRGRGRADASDALDEDAYHLRARHPPDSEFVETQTSETISLPDTLLSILSLAPTSRGREDEHVVDRLLYGDRRGNYDASKGGEIWGVGEFEKRSGMSLPRIPAQAVARRERCTMMKTIGKEKVSLGRSGRCKLSCLQPPPLHSDEQSHTTTTRSATVIVSRTFIA
ncbi:hypothetical protein C8R46DRAFT_224055 [Mycena filopes]|nr:hypothetical protein C8R46DRAFT_224055 [Mycena filopes]